MNRLGRETKHLKKELKVFNERNPQQRVLFYVLNFISITLNISYYLSFKNGDMGQNKELASNWSEHLLDFKDYFKEQISYKTYL